MPCSNPVCSLCGRRHGWWIDAVAVSLVLGLVLSVGWWAYLQVAPVLR